jgi:hypothetical protein
MEFIEWLKRRKEHEEENLRYAETTPGFRLFQVTAGGGQIEITDSHKDRLRKAIGEYEKVIRDLELRASGALPASNRPYSIK